MRAAREAPARAGDHVPRDGPDQHGAARRRSKPRLLAAARRLGYAAHVGRVPRTADVRDLAQACGLVRSGPVQHPGVDHNRVPGRPHPRGGDQSGNVGLRAVQPLVPPPAYSPRLPAILSKEAPSDSPPVLVSAPSLLNPEAPSFQMPEASPGPVLVEIEVPRRTVSFDVPPSPRPLLRPDEKSIAAPCVGRACLNIAAECKQRITVLPSNTTPP